jgi:1,4-dihydroxy-6-naphthoate synthase
MPSTDTIDLTIAHSPDPDDAFMWLALGNVDSGIEPLIDTGRFRFRPVTLDIETLNRRAIESGDLDITAISMHTYAHVHDRYALTACGASMGVGYGPKVVAMHQHDVEWLRTSGLRIASPGSKTTAHLTLRLLLGGDFNAVETDFDRVTELVLNNQADAGVVIHEGQLTFESEGLCLVVDLGAWWMQETGLPLPLGGNAVRRDLDDRYGAGTLESLAGVLRQSIEHSLRNRSDALAHAKQFGRAVSDEQNDEFVRMYVNDLTLDAGETGQAAVQALLDRAAAAGISPKPGKIRFV